MIRLLVPLILVILPLDYAITYSLNLPPTAPKPARWMLNVENILLTIICTRIVKLGFVTRLLDLALLKMILRPTASVKLVANQVLTVMKLNVFG